jgi:hypothetical protein
MNILLLLPLALPSSALEVTVYNQDLGLVRDVRTFSFKSGVQDLSVVDVAARIDATSVHIKSLTAPEAVSVLEQNFQYDLISTDKLLQKYLDKEIELERVVGLGGDKREKIRGTLLSATGGMVLKSEGKILINPAGSPVLPELPEGLMTRPTLLWKLDSSKAGAHETEISYLTGGMNWQSDYVAVANADDTKMDLNAWVTVNNASGATYKNAKLKLVAGDVHRAQEEGYQDKMMYLRAASVAKEERGFQERGFFEYHLYALQRPTTLRDNETKQIELASAANVPMKKLYVYDGARGAKKVAVILEFKNSKSDNLGMPLPKGRVRVYKKDTDGSLILAGEDNIDHTPKDEKVRVKMGEAFDVVGERKQTDTKLDTRGRRVQESFEIKLRNHKDSDVVVTVVERFHGYLGWKFEAQSHKHEKKDSQTAEFQIPVKKDGETVLTYTVKYSW